MRHVLIVCLLLSCGAWADRDKDKEGERRGRRSSREIPNVQEEAAKETRETRRSHKSPPVAATPSHSAGTGSAASMKLARVPFKCNEAELATYTAAQLFKCADEALEADLVVRRNLGGPSPSTARKQVAKLSAYLSALEKFARANDEAACVATNDRDRLRAIQKRRNEIAVRVEELRRADSPEPILDAEGKTDFDPRTAEQIRILQDEDGDLDFEAWAIDYTLSGSQMVEQKQLYEGMISRLTGDLQKLYDQLPKLTSENSSELEKVRNAIRWKEASLKRCKSRLAVVQTRMSQPIQTACRYNAEQRSALKLRTELIARVEGKPSGPGSPTWVSWRTMAEGDTEKN